jgi:hypothetical protein
MADGMLEIRVDKKSDPSRLRRILELQLEYERMHSARHMLVHLLAFLGIIVWVEALAPEMLPRELRLFTFVLWGSFFFLTLWISVEEFFLWRRIANYQKGGLVLRK